MRTTLSVTKCWRSGSKRPYRPWAFTIRTPSFRGQTLSKCHQSRPKVQASHHRVSFSLPSLTFTYRRYFTFLQTVAAHSWALTKFPREFCTPENRLLEQPVRLWEAQQWPIQTLMARPISWVDSTPLLFFSSMRLFCIRKAWKSTINRSRSWPSYLTSTVWSRTCQRCR